jgi:tetratricopeptide (TPR) repeat protein
MNSKKALLIFNFLFILIIQVVAQTSFSGNDLGSDFNRAMDLYNKEKYAAAIRLFDTYLKNDKDNSRIHLAEAEYLAALSALKLFNPDSEYRMIIYMATHPEVRRSMKQGSPSEIIFTRTKVTGRPVHIMRSLTDMNWRMISCRNTFSDMGTLYM